MKPAIFIVLMSLLLAVPAFAVDLSDAEIKGNLANVPATDPKPTDVPAMVAAMKGQHPRLLFTKAEIEVLKKQIESDPILKKAYADNAAWAKKFKLATAWHPKDIVADDTSALTMVKSWPGLAYVYAIDHDPALKTEIVNILQMMLDQPYWAMAAELDSNMGAGNNMFMVGVLFDVVADDLEPAFRAKMAQKIVTHIRRMYYLGHLQLSLCPIKYWQQDTQNNHRWHRDCGMAACLMALADEKSVDIGYMLQQFKAEMDFLIKWYPNDGDCHEGAGYQTFGFFYLAFAAEMTDRVLGTTYLKAPGFANAYAQHLYFWAPGRMSDISFGDDMNSEGAYDNQEAAFFLCPHLSRDKNAQAALVHQFEKKAHLADPKRVYTFPWALLAFCDPTLAGGDYKAFPTNRLFPDIGAASMRDSWEDDAVCLTFKCGPYGGNKMNEYLMTVRDPKTGKPHYVNVAHDDPDANAFAVGTSGAFLFHPGLYSLNKLTENENTLTVDGKGQICEGTDFMQPVPDTDMRTLCYLTGWKTGPKGQVIIEGEAAKSYQDVKTRVSPLTRFRRTAIWMPGEYILLLDDIAADGKHHITWRGTVQKGQFDKPETGHCYALAKNGKRLDFQMLANQEFDGAIDYKYLDGRFGNEMCQQFQFSVDAAAVKFACLMDPWKKKPEMTLTETGGSVTLTVKSAAFNDTWTWKPAADATTPSSLTGTRQGKELISLTEKDKAPTE